MARPNEALPEIDALFAAADAHAAAACDPDYVVGDLQEILRATWTILTPAQRAAVFREPELIALAGLPEYEPLIGHVVPAR